MQKGFIFVPTNKRINNIIKQKTMTATVYTSECHKVEIVNNMVSSFELMGGRWVRLSNPVLWDEELIKEEFDL